MLLYTLFSSPLLFATVAIALIVAITFHEAAHAYVSYIKGDSTAKDAGRLTLNPFQHLDIMGTAFLLIAGFGWGKPVPVNHRALKNPIIDEIQISLAGPLANLIVALFFGFIYHFLSSYLSPALENLILFIGYFNLLLMIFNLIPIPPLDGSKILNIFISNKARFFLETYGMYILLLMIIVPFGGSRLIEFIIGRPVSLLFTVIFSGSNLF